VVTRQLQVERRTGKVSFYHCATQLNKIAGVNRSRRSFWCLIALLSLISYHLRCIQSCCRGYKRRRHVIIGPHRMYSVHKMRPVAAHQVCVSVRLSVCSSVSHFCEPCKNCWTDRDADWRVNLRGPKEPCSRWGHQDPHGKGPFWYGVYAAEIYNGNSGTVAAARNAPDWSVSHYITPPCYAAFCQKFFDHLLCYSDDKCTLFLRITLKLRRVPWRARSALACNGNLGRSPKRASDGQAEPPVGGQGRNSSETKGFCAFCVSKRSRKFAQWLIFDKKSLNHTVNERFIV